MRTAPLTLAALLVSGCATTAKYEEKLSSWVGGDAAALVNSWGYPSNSFEAPNGNKVYVYQRGGSMVMPTTYQTTANATGYGNTAYGAATTNVYGGQTLTFWCNTFFEVSPANRIVRWRWEGNDCVSK